MGDKRPEATGFMTADFDQQRWRHATSSDTCRLQLKQAASSNGHDQNDGRQQAVRADSDICPHQQ